MTHNLEEADIIYHEMSEKHPDYAHKLVMEWRDNMPKSYIRRMNQERYGCHLDEELYDEATALFTNPDGTQGPHWSVATIKAKSGIDFTTKEYTCYDFAYVVNMLYSDYSTVFIDPNYYLKMAKAYLTDEDYPGDKVSERAYHDALHRIAYFEHH